MTRTATPNTPVSPMVSEHLEATPCVDEITTGLRGVVDRIAQVPKRVVLRGPEAISSTSDDFGQAAACLNRVESGLYGLWPEDETQA